MAIADDFTVDFINKNLATAQTYVDGIPPLIYSMNEFYSFLQDLFDEPANMDIEVPMSAQTPNEYTMINGWFIDDETIKSLFGGALATDATWTRVTSTTTGIVQFDYAATVADFAGSDVGLPIVSSAVDAGVLLAFSNVAAGRGVCWVRPDSSAVGDDWDSAAATATITGGTGNITQTTAAGTGLTTWGNIFSLGTIVTDTELYVIQVNNFFEIAAPLLTKISRWWTEDTAFTDPNGFGGAGTGQIDLMIKVREVGALVDGGFLNVFARQSNKLYSNFSATLTGGRTPIPLGSADDLNENSGYRHNIATTTSGALIAGDVVVGGTSAAEGVVTATTGVTPNLIFDYYLIGPSDATTGALVDFSGAEALTTTGGYAATSGTLSNVNQALNTSITATFAHDETLDINEDDAVENYGIVVDCNSTALGTVYERLKFLTRRGETTDIATGTQVVIGESYVGIGEIRAGYDAEGTGGSCQEGEAVTGSLSGATGIVTELDDNGTTGYIIIRQVRGVFEENDIVSEDGDATSSVTLTTVIDTVAPVPTAPFGTFAGGKFFGATGVALINFLAADANNFQLIDSEGNGVFPPNKVTVEITGLIAGDRGAIFRVTAPGGTIINKTEMSVVVGGAALSATTIEVDSAIAADVPGKATGGFLRVRDVTDNSEYRYKYASWSSATFTLTTHADFSAVTDGETPDSITLIDSSVAFLTNGNVEVGMEIENDTTGDIATIVTVTDGQLITTPLTGAGDTLWNTGDAYTINAVVVALVDADDLYVGIIDGVVPVAGTSLSNTLVYLGDLDVISRVRQSTTGTKILPFVATGGTVATTGISVAAIRTDDSIVT